MIRRAETLRTMVDDDPLDAKRSLLPQGIGAALLTHTHADHWRERTLAQLARREIPLFCHSSHTADLRSRSSTATAKPSMRLSASFIGPAAFWFVASPASRFRAAEHAADLGSWDAHLAEWLVGADLVALEFNHDAGLQRQSGRPATLTARVLGDQGHLSNEQAAALLAEVVRQSRPGRLKHVVQLHLSLQCNRPHLAKSAAASVLASSKVRIALHTSSQHASLQIQAMESGAPR